MGSITDSYTEDVSILWGDFRGLFRDIADHFDNMPTGNKMHEDTLYAVPVVLPEGEQVEKTVCSMIADIANWSKWSAEIAGIIAEIPVKFVYLVAALAGETSEYAGQLVNMGEAKALKWAVDTINSGTEWIANTKLAKDCVKLYKSTVLYAQLGVKYAEKYIYMALKWILEITANGYIASALGVAFEAIIVALQFLFEILDTISQSIMLIPLALKPTGMSLDGGLMGFFTTPKSFILSPVTMGTVTMTPLNNDRSIFGGVPNIIYILADGFIKPIKIANKEVKSGIITAAAATAAATQEIVDVSGLEKISAVGMDAVMKFVNSIVMLWPMADPLPSYDRLKIINVSFAMWLLTGFELGMKKCFGIPGMP